ncbi:MULTISPECIES: phosphodiesterase [unclassified Agarivorans]|uniref:phosphodiesterase n=1 Tax=unclassified Agarivorans TaxID=2636026 RepID=UPI0026E294F8|nr:MULTISPECIES: phosphodiesterase [unclassified Agarivorans]MDO6684889.1 phosphodiesterase [Agarivorans sp. 3_MG-2023]MDO6714950.1 phosphodiesterase [Agarivorans sp. 2_MG-2023]
MLFVCSDIHGDFNALQLTLSAFKRSGASHFICLGDVLNHGPRNPVPKHYAPLKVAEALNTIAERTIAVRGNCDSEVDQALCKFPIMAEYNQLLLDSRKVFLCHGHTFGPSHLPPLAAGDILVSGHSHIPQAHLESQHYLLNPGSVAIPRQDWPASYALITEQQLQVLKLDDHSPLVSCSLE